MSEDRFRGQLQECDLYFCTDDHPEANGRTPQVGDKGWLLQFGLDDGRRLRIGIGASRMQLFRDMLAQMGADDAAIGLLGPSVCDE